MTRSHPIPKRLFRSAVTKCCPHTDCEHRDAYSCSGWSYVKDALEAVPDGWAKIAGRWVQVTDAPGYEVRGPSGVVDSAVVLVALLLGGAEGEGRE